MFRDILKYFLDVIFPNRCLGCDDIIDFDDLVCKKCFDQIHFTNWSYGENKLKQKAEFLFPIHKAYAIMYFDKKGMSRKIIHQLKYNNQEKIGKILAKWVSNDLDFNGEKPDLLLNVPLHPKKMKERGYNQLHIFTEKLSKYYDIPYHHDLLIRNNYGRSQAQKNKSLRIDSNYSFSLTKKIENKHILIIDDVFTTGNTMASVAWEILKYKNNKISVLVMAFDE